MSNTTISTRPQPATRSRPLVSQAWVAFGPAGALGSVHRIQSGFAVRLLNDDDYRGVYPTLEVAKHALHAALLPGSDWPEFREH
jgi:hypothetical protein